VYNVHARNIGNILCHFMYYTHYSRHSTQTRVACGALRRIYSNKNDHTNITYCYGVYVVRTCFNIINIMQLKIIGY